MKRVTLRFVVLVLAALLCGPAHASSGAEGTQLLWEEVERLDQTIRDNHDQARTDIKRGLTMSALQRYKAVALDVGKEIALLEALYEREQELDRQMDALTQLGAARDLQDRAKDMITMLERMSRT